MFEEEDEGPGESSHQGINGGPPRDSLSHFEKISRWLAEKTEEDDAILAEFLAEYDRHGEGSAFTNWLFKTLSILVATYLGVGAFSQAGYDTALDFYKLIGLADVRVDSWIVHLLASAYTTIYGAFSIDNGIKFHQEVADSLKKFFTQFLCMPKEARVTYQVKDMLISFACFVAGAASSFGSVVAVDQAQAAGVTDHLGDTYNLLLGGEASKLDAQISAVATNARNMINFHFKEPGDQLASFFEKVQEILLNMPRDKQVLALSDYLLVRKNKGVEAAIHEHFTAQYPDKEESFYDSLTKLTQTMLAVLSIDACREAFEHSAHFQQYKAVSKWVSAGAAILYYGISGASLFSQGYAWQAVLTWLFSTTANFAIQYKTGENIATMPYQALKAAEGGGMLNVDKWQFAVVGTLSLVALATTGALGFSLVTEVMGADWLSLAVAGVVSGSSGVANFGLAFSGLQRLSNSAWAGLGSRFKDVQALLAGRDCEHSNFYKCHEVAFQKKARREAVKKDFMANMSAVIETLRACPATDNPEAKFFPMAMQAILSEGVKAALEEIKYSDPARVAENMSNILDHLEVELTFSDPERDAAEAESPLLPRASSSYHSLACSHSRDALTPVLQDLEGGDRSTESSPLLVRSSTSANLLRTSSSYHTPSPIAEKPIGLQVSHAGHRLFQTLRSAASTSSSGLLDSVLFLEENMTTTNQQPGAFTP